MASMHKSLATEVISQRICPICEAGCGLNIKTRGRLVTGITANPQDVFSTGHICAKGISLQALDADPDRLRTPLIKHHGEFREASWAEAFGFINQRLAEIRGKHTNPQHGNRTAMYIGNPTAHNIGLSMGLGTFASVLGSSNIFSAGSVDQLPKQLACELMYGNGMAIAVPDIERCDLLLMLGANPIVSNGSLWMVPKFRDKLRAMQARGGHFVTVDPRRSETARLADTYLPINPGTDAWLLSALINELHRLGARVPDRYQARQAAELLQSLASITLAQAATATGISAEAISTLATRLHQAQAAAVYGRVGTTLQKFGTLTSFLIDVVNILTDNLDKAGGAMFPEQPFVAASHAHKHPDAGPQYNRYQSRVSGYPEVLGQMPAVALAEEILTAGDQQIQALVCFAGNPVVSHPASDQLERALASLDLLVCVDIYHNETSKHAHVILPGSSPFEDSHYDSFLGAMGYRNTARYSPPVFATDNPREWDLGLTLAYITARQQVPNAVALQDFEDTVVAAAVAAYTEDPGSPLFKRDVQEIMALIGPQQGVERLLDLGIRAGRWGDHFGAATASASLTLQALIDTPDGIDLGALRGQRLQEIVGHRDPHINLGPQAILDDIRRLQATLPAADLPPAESPDYPWQLIGRRNAQANNSWLHNLPVLAKGRDICTLEIHPRDAELLGISSGDKVIVSTAEASIEVSASVSDAIKPGVVSLPHGFSEDSQIRQHQARKGANYNRLVSTNSIDLPSATAALNGISVAIRKVL